MRNNYQFLYKIIVICFFCLVSFMFIYLLKNLSKEQFQLFLIVQFLFFIISIKQVCLKEDKNKILFFNNRIKSGGFYQKRFYSTKPEFLIKELGLWKSFSFILSSNSYHWLGDRYPLL